MAISNAYISNGPTTSLLIDLLVGSDMTSLSGLVEVLGMHCSCLFCGHLVLKRLSRRKVGLALLDIMVFGSHREKSRDQLTVIPFG